MSKDKKETFNAMKDFDLNIREKKLELFATWEQMFNLCKTIVAQAQANPTKIKSTLLAQAVRILSTSYKILKEADEFKKEIEEELERYDEETGEEKMTEDEAEMLAQFEEMKDSLGLYQPNGEDHNSSEVPCLDEDFKDIP
jgi:hypothetical protein